LRRDLSFKKENAKRCHFVEERREDNNGRRGKGRTAALEKKTGGTSVIKRGDPMQGPRT